MISTQQPGRRSKRSLLAAGILALSLNGCATFWDDVTSREFKVADLWTRPPEPMVVLRDSSDATRRSKALTELKEPLRNGGTPQDQDVYLQILTTAAKSDREPLCRLGAIRALGSYKDARAARALEDVYQQPKLPFTQEFNSTIRQQALASLERVGDADSRHLLIRVARQPGPPIDSGLADRQQTQDEKMIAIRALGKYKGQESLETLVHVMKTEKDVAVRDQAHDALELVTGKRLPSDNAYWQQQTDALALQPAPNLEPNFIQRVAGWAVK